MTRHFCVEQTGGKGGSWAIPVPAITLHPPQQLLQQARTSKVSAAGREGYLGENEQGCEENEPELGPIGAKCTTTIISLPRLR